MSERSQPVELKDIEELEQHGTAQGKKPVEHIRAMNPGTYIPTGEELAAKIRAQNSYSDKEE